LIVDQLLGDIRIGIIPVGSALPTESELMRAFGVSRHTVRSAVQLLRQQGVVTSRQGQGSRVLAAVPSATLVERIQSVDQLFKFGQFTKRTLLSSSIIEADDDLAASFASNTGRRLIKAQMLRRGMEPDAKPVAHVTIWMDALFEQAVQDLDQMQLSVAELLQRRFNVTLGAVRQTVSATLLDASIARFLERKAGEPALIIDRIYLENVDGPAYLRALSVCAAEVMHLESLFTSSVSDDSTLS
jgi:DNA-binding GntR family transcriptional regulator